MSSIDDKISIEVCTCFETFKLCFEKYEKVETVKKKLRKNIKEKLSISNDIIIEFEIVPDPTINQTIWDWSRDISNPSIKIILKTKNQASKNINQDLFDITSSIGILAVMEQSRNIQLENAIKQIEIKNDSMVEKIKQDNDKLLQELELKVKRMQGCLDASENIHPLLDLVSRFRLEIIKRLKIDNIIPLNLNDWNLVYDHLKDQRNLQAVDETVEKLGFSENDWDTLKYHCKENNNLKHPEPRITKEIAIEKINTLKGTKYSDCATPLIHLIDIFDKNNW